MKQPMKKSLTAAFTALSLSLSGCAGFDGMQMGSQRAKTSATGAAGGANAQNVNEELERCESALGTISLVENQHAGWYTIWRDQYKLPPTAQLLRLMIQQSNCFVVVERSAAGMQAMQRERALMGAGQMREGSQMGGGQMVASDYSLSPDVIFSDGNTGGMGGGIGGGSGSLLGAFLLNTKTREASVMLTLVDNRSGVQVSVSEGSASKTDWGGLGAILGGRAGGGFGAYTRTPQGKVIVAAFMDGYNQMVRSLHNYQAQTVRGQGLGGGGRLGVDGGAGPSQTSIANSSSRNGNNASNSNGGSGMTLRAAQQKLNELGYDAGTADGIMGARTRTALTQFQADHNLPSTGRLDAATAQALQKR